MDCRSTLSDTQLEALITGVLNGLAGQDSALAREFGKLSGTFGVQESALGNFFKILQEKQIPVEELDRRLREIAQRHLGMIDRLDRAGRSAADDAEVADYLRGARALVEKGDYDGADGLLSRAETLDVDAIEQQQEALGLRALRAAETRAERAELRLLRFDYAEGAELFAAAADLVQAERPMSAARYANRAGQAYEDAALYRAALPHFQRSLALREQHLSADDPEIAVALNNLAALYKETGRYAEAEPLMKRVLSIDEAAYGPDHPDVAIDLNNLAQLYEATGRYAEAEPLMKRALGIEEAKRGPDHPYVAINLNNLAQLYQATGRYAEAEPLMKRALGIFEASLGPDHPNTRIVRRNLKAVSGRD